jgi:hypothetical protein
MKTELNDSFLRKTLPSLHEYFLGKNQPEIGIAWLIADTTDGLETTFDRIVSLSENCKFKDCTQTHETGCSVLEDVEKGETNKSFYENYLKMQREKVLSLNSFISF